MNKHLQFARILTRLLDSSFGVGRFKFGLDPLIGAVPVVGDIIGLAISFYLIWVARKMKLPEEELIKMTRNLLLDFVLGVIPFVGDITDFVFKSNSRNLQILEKYKDRVIIDAKTV